MKLELMIVILVFLSWPQLESGKRERRKGKKFEKKIKMVKL